MMLRKGSRPALYEIMERRGAATPTPEREQASPRIPWSEWAGQWLGSGRTVRVPIGYVFLAGGLAIVILSMFYIGGYKRGAAAERHRFVEQFANQSVGHIEDPLVTLEPSGRETQIEVRAPQSSSGLLAGVTKTNQNLEGESNWGPIVSPRGQDPRVKGLMYFVLAETTEKGATRLAEFCRSHGLEAYVVAGGNSRRRRVITLPGFTEAQRMTEQVLTLERFIHSIGDKWKKEAGGTTNLRDTYPRPYHG